jgi:hypothetical protein
MSEKPTITIHGASDDLVEVDGCKGADEFGADDWSAELVAPDGGQMRVYCRFEDNGCWSVGVSQVDEDVPLPSWPLTITQQERGGSALLTIDAPEGTRLTNVKG